MSRFVRPPSIHVLLPWLCIVGLVTGGGCASTSAAPPQEVPQACCRDGAAACVLGLPQKEGERCLCPDADFTLMIDQWRSLEKDIVRQEAQLRALERQPVDDEQRQKVADAKALVTQQRQVQEELLQVLLHKRDQTLLQAGDDEVGDVCREPVAR